MIWYDKNKNLLFVVRIVEKMYRVISGMDYIMTIRYSRKSTGCNTLGYLSQTHLKLKYRKLLFVYKIQIFFQSCCNFA